jgi:prepilin-type N-terminal cleavage/methylation domain-containing protein
MKRHRTEKGFTLIETLLAVAVLVLSISGPLTIAAKSLNSAVFAKDQITAFYLAQEAVEYVRNVRDANALHGRDSTDSTSANYWLTGLTDCINTECKVESTNVSASSAITPCLGSECTLLYDPSTGFYGYSQGSASIFTRSVRLEKVNDNEYRVVSTVSWQNGSVTSSFVVQENILDWE